MMNQCSFTGLIKTKPTRKATKYGEDMTRFVLLNRGMDGRKSLYLGVISFKVPESVFSELSIGVPVFVSGKLFSTRFAKTGQWVISLFADEVRILSQPPEKESAPEAVSPKLTAG